MAGFKIEVPKYPKMSMGGTIDAYTKEQADELFQEKLTEKQLANISSVTDKADKLVEDIRYYYGTENIVPTDSSYFVYTDKGDGTCVISGVKENFSGTELIFPHEIDCLKVVELAPYTTSDNNSATTQITSIIMPDTVVKLSDNAFYYANLPNVTKIRLSNNLSTVGVMSLPNVQILDELYVPDSLVNVGAMNHFTSMALRVSLPHHLFSHSEPGYTEDNAVITIRGGTETGAGAPCLGYGKNVTVILPDTCIRILSYLFWDMENPVLVVPSSVTEILQSEGAEGASIFSGCTNPTIICEQGSYADSFAQEYGINVKYNLVGNFYSREQADSKFQEKLSEKQLKNISAVEKKVDEEEGKGLSTNDYTNEEKQEVAKINGKTDVSYVKNTFANVLKGTASGEALGLNDVSPIEHEMSVKVRGKNLIPYPFADTTKTHNGITFTDNGDGSITANGTATASAIFYLWQNETEGLHDGVYSLSGNPNSQGAIYCRGFDTSIQIGMTQDTGSGSANNTITGKYDKGISVFYRINSGETVENLVIKPQLELGSVITSYAPYVPDVSAVSLKKYGKNLFDGVFETGIWSGTNGKPYDNDTRIRSKNFIKVTEGVSYIITFEGYDVACLIYEYDRDYNYIPTNGTNLVISHGKPYTPTNGVKYIHFAPSSTVTAEVIDTIKCQMEVGIVATEYEPYKEPVTYTPNADGTVEGVTSLYPSTTLMTDTNGIIIDCEYNRDINKAFAELQQAIISLGGNV